MPRYYARRRRLPQSSRSVGACRRPDAPYGRTPRSLKVLGQHLEGGQPNSSARRRRTSRRDVVLTRRDRDTSRRVLNRVGCCCLHSHSHAFTDDRRAPGKLVITREPPGWRGPRKRPQGSPRSHHTHNIFDISAPTSHHQSSHHNHFSHQNPSFSLPPASSLRLQTPSHSRTRASSRSASGGAYAPARTLRSRACC